MTVGSILVPTDFSPTSDKALRYATQMALTLGARLYLVHVPGKTGEHFEADFPHAQYEKSAAKRLESFLTAEEIKRLRPEYAIRVGPAAEEIARYAELCSVDLIIMGTHGRTGLAHVVLGSVAEQVVHIAPCPVLLIRLGARVVTDEPVAVVEPAASRVAAR